jgi:glycosyltransferase involved in cell wall biosynthesis
MKILLCCHVPLTARQGAAKVYLEAAEAFRNVGWQADLVGPDAVGCSLGIPDYHAALARGLREHLRAEAGRYDVVEFEHTNLPYPRAEFPPGPLFVARSVLLLHHMLTVPVPRPPGLRNWLGRLLRGGARRAAIEGLAVQTDATLREAELVNVPNEDDAAEVVRAGVDRGSVSVFPFGILRRRRPLFDAVPEATPPGDPVVAFVGTFDPRKGMCEFPALVRRVAERVPRVRFRLLGTAGMVRTREGVLGYFPRRLRARLDVVPEYEPDQLPGHLAGCSVGVFPSYFEGFPFGVLEMLACALPVAAYRAPGAPMMLPPDLLVPRGDAAAMADKVAGLLGRPDDLQQARGRAREISRRFCWEDVARRTAAAYRRRLAAGPACGPSLAGS